MMAVRQWLLIAPLVLTWRWPEHPRHLANPRRPEAAAGTCIPEGGIPNKIAI